MSYPVLLFLTLLSISSSSAYTVRAPARCRCLPKDPCWPSPTDWSAFNASINGALIKAVPPASPCHDPNYDANACAFVKQQWYNPIWRGDQPGGMQDPAWEGLNNTETCSIKANRTAPCNQGAVPTYVVNATRPDQISTTIKFVNEHWLRVVIKNTGHDFGGRSTAAGAVSVWVHHMKSVEFLDGFVPSGCKVEAKKAVKVGAGVQWGELYKMADEKGLVVVGGQDRTVGAAGGIVQAGGHSALSPYKGLVSDNVLEYTVVTTSGEQLTVNSCTNADLFWALRGGGGGTYAIVTSATYETFPTPPQIVALVNVTAPSNTSSDTSYEQFIHDFIAEFPRLSDAGWAGYAYYLDNFLVAIFNLPNGTMESANKSLSFFSNYTQRNPTSSLIITPTIFSAPSFYTFFNSSTGLGSGPPPDTSTPNPDAPTTYVSFSRLLPHSTFITSPRKISNALLEMRSPSTIHILHLVGGGAVSRYPTSYTAANPAWRKALLHVVAVNPTSTKPMEELSDAAYFNELGNIVQDQKVFWGEHLGKLRELKKKWDPKGLLWCWQCVGWEEWEADGNCKRWGGAESVN